MTSLHRRMTTLAIAAVAAVAAVAPAGAQTTYWGDNAEVVFVAAPNHAGVGTPATSFDAKGKEALYF